MDCKDSIDFTFDYGGDPPELAICWYIGKMLATKKYLNDFLKRYLEKDIESAKNVSEKFFGKKD